ncbi:hypothetical protein HK097_005337 [Rhizophlyctis rosea]|uniref:Ankyrin repeat protein n=1 Tax=Rhizophlyctis rosea TaxID=64517 RepID=A0AAD5SKF9_9FUNG|nr:hypothetical protein HK097_005337 [Rhizophlyctis rosea]
MATENNPTILALPTDVFSTIVRHAHPTAAYRLPRTSRIIRSAISKKDIKLSEYYHRYKHSQSDCFSWAIRHYHTDVLAYQIPTANLTQLVELIDHACANQLPIVDLARLALQSGSLRLGWETDGSAIWLKTRHITGILEVPAKHGDAALVSLFLQADRGAAAGDNNGSVTREQLGRALYQAACQGHKSVVKLLLDAGADPDEGIDSAAEYGHVDVVELLLDAGGHVDDAMDGAAVGNHLDLVVLLIDRGADLDGALQMAAQSGSIEIVRWLLEEGATSHIQDHCYNTVASAIDSGSIETLDILLTAGGKLHICPVCEGPLKTAVGFGTVQMVKFLLDRGLAISHGPRGTLYVASSRGDTEIVKLLLQAGAAHADLNTSLATVAERGTAAIGRLMTPHADSPISEVAEKAARYGGVDILYLLVEAGADSSAIEDPALRQMVLRRIQSAALARRNL